MAKFNLTERYDFQQWILQDLVQNNQYIQRPQFAYDSRLAMDVDVLWEFLIATQEETMETLLKKIDKQTIVNLINREIIKGGFLFALKSGVFVENKKIDLMYSKPATSFNEKANQHYLENRFTVMEEANYKNDERIDLVIFLNGLAIFAIELKFNANGQSVEDGIRQLKKRMLIIVCSSLTQVY